MRSLNRRLLIAASLVLMVFLGLTGLVLDRAFRESAEAAVRDRLLGQVYALLAAAEVHADGQLLLPRTPAEARLSTPGSGLYASISDDSGQSVWRSPSVLGLEVPFAMTTDVGAPAFSRATAADHTAYFTLALAVDWEREAGGPMRYVFQATESTDAFLTQIGSFRRSLWGWLVGVAIVLLAVQGSILRWGLAPLRRVALDLSSIKAGEAERLEGNYPRELLTLTDSINSFIASERSSRDRYRHTLGDLAHSLKTPLAVVRGALEHPALPGELRAGLHEQVDRMNQIVDYQLQRAATSGKKTLAAPVCLKRAIERICATLDKVYAAKGIRCDLRVADEAVFRGDEGDLLELLGNLLDNAYKWGRKIVQVGVVSVQAPVPELIVTIEDDGAGIPEDRRAEVLQRGVRADQKTTGHGIGLAVAQDILGAYGGRLEIGRSVLGGARIGLTLPDE